jgi:rubrerythrin
MGDPACWMAMVCPECGALVEDEAAERCPRCGAARPDDEAAAGPEGAAAG